MFDQIFQNLMAQSGSWISAIFSQAVLRQVAAFLVILVTAWLLQFLLQRLLYALASRFGQTSWTRPIFTVISQALLLIMALILSQPVLVIFRTWGWTDHGWVGYHRVRCYRHLLYAGTWYPAVSGANFLGIGIRSMIVKTPDNIELIIPNSRFLTETMVNLTRTDPRVRVRISVGVTPAANPREVEQALLAATQHPYVLNEPAPSVQFQGFGSGSLNFDLLVWTSEPARIPVLTSDLRYSMWDALAVHHIEMAWPQPDIHVHLNESKPDNSSPTN